MYNVLESQDQAATEVPRVMKPRHFRRRLRIGSGSLVLIAGLGCTSAAEIIHTEPSQFSPIIVYESGTERCMKFGSIHALGRQSCFEPAAPEKMVFDYTRTMMTALFVRPQINRALVIGLGGGTLPMALQKIAPQARLDTVEIDPAVVSVAKRFFGYKPGPNHYIHVADGREYVQRAIAEGAKYDLIMLDAFDTQYIPAHLMTREFLEELKTLLVPGGVLAANTFSASKLYQRESATYAAVFGSFFNLRSGNRVIFAVNGTLPNDETLRRNAQALQPLYASFGIDVDYQLNRFARTSPDEHDGAPLTDAELETKQVTTSVHPSVGINYSWNTFPASCPSMSTMAEKAKGNASNAAAPLTCGAA